ncbi:uncharacterized protein LOC134844986 [Symsagittifera roscoffensis]|uniref:uncharacterized protein LOC134844986 n=1 Tax=Symsagittifera roscoffensis TaxID=84072 RepID=UPI00307C1148
MNDEIGYCSQFSSKIRPLLDQYDIIRHHLVDDPDLHPTSIVVIGDQSSGKSSVLESLVQIGLPRGENIVTRMPIVLQCRSLRTTNVKDFPHAKISISSPNDERSFTLTDFSQIEQTIQTCQATVFQSSLSSSSSGGNGGGNSKNVISDVPIYVQVVKEGIPDVTLVDLPGINYANEVIKNSIKSLYEKYISPDNVIILNVISAVTDIHANESVLFAHKESIDILQVSYLPILSIIQFIILSFPSIVKL